MVRTTALAALFALGGLVAPCRAADPVAETEKFLRDDEKSLLAALRTRKAESAEFDADAKASLGDARLRKLFLDKWRGKVAAFAQSDAKHPDPNLEGKYRNYAEMLTPEIRAYLERRIPTMKEKDSNALIEYLEAINASLADDQKLSWYTKKVVSGIFDKYRGELTTYLDTPLAQDGLRNGPSAAKMLAEARAAKETPVEQPAKVNPPATKTPGAGKTPAGGKKQPGGPNADGIPVETAPGNGVVLNPDPTDDAKRQLEDAAKNGENLGGNYDGDVKTGDDPVTPVDAGAVGDKTAPGLQPADQSGGTPNLTADVPPPPAEESFMDRIKKLRTSKGKPSEPTSKYAPHAIGGLVLGILGFFLGGPAAAALGVAVGIAVGAMVSKKLFS